MSISNFNREEVKAIIDEVGLAVHPHASRKLTVVLNRETPLLVKRLQLAPVPGSADLGKDAYAIALKIRLLLERMGASVPLPFELEAEQQAPRWPPAIMALIEEQASNVSEDPGEQIDNLVRQLLSLYRELHRLRNRIMGPLTIKKVSSYSNARKAIVRQFLDQLLDVFPEMYGEKPSVIKMPGSKDDPSITHGKGVRFIRAVLNSTKRKMTLSGLEALAKDAAMNISSDTAARWIYDYSNKND